MRVNGASVHVCIDNVYYVPSLAKNLLSTTRVAARGCAIVITAGGCHICDRTGRVVLEAKARSNMLELDLKPVALHNAMEPPVVVCAVTRGQETLLEAHRRLGHVSEERLRLALKQTGVIVPTTERLPKCVVCARGKLARKPISDGPAPHATKAMERVHSNVCGLFPMAAVGGWQYYVSFICDTTRFAHQGQE